MNFKTDEEAMRWAKDLADDVARVIERFPDADPEDVRHTLILLQMPPWDRLERSLRRGRATPVLRTLKSASLKRSRNTMFYSWWWACLLLFCKALQS